MRQPPAPARSRAPWTDLVIFKQLLFLLDGFKIPVLKLSQKSPPRSHSNSYGLMS